MARTSRRQPNSYRGGRVVGNLAYDERYAERRAPRRESEHALQHNIASICMTSLMRLASSIPLP